MDNIQHNIRFDNSYIYYSDGRKEYRDSLQKYPRLQKASIEELNNYTLTPFGIHWEKLDEDLSFEGFKNT